MKFPRKHLILLGIFILLAAPCFGATYNLDKTHTTVGFKVKHIFSWVNGTFNSFDGSFVYDPEHPETWKAEATIQAASIDTGVEARDKHLRSKDFFDVEQFPTITFKSTQVTDVTAETTKLHGLLSIHGVEKPVVLDMDILGVATDPWGNTVAGFSATTKVNRKDFGLTWNEVLETGQLLVGEEIVITLDVTGSLVS